MQVAVRRPHFAAGVALVGASVIAASAVTPMPAIHLPDIELPVVHMADVDLAALANPLEIYSQVFQSALANTNTLIQNTVPGQLLNQILQNQVGSAAALLDGLSTTGGAIAGAAAQVPAALTTAVAQLTAGNVEGAVNTLLGIPLNVIAPATGLLPVLQTVLTQPLTNLVNVINTFTRDPLATLLAVSGFIAPLISVPGAAAAAIQNVINAVGTGDLGAVANAVLTAPATIVDGLLNGGYGPDLGPLAGIPAGSGIIVKAGGLLSSSGITFDENFNAILNTGGPLYALQQVLSMITKAITPAVPAAAASIASLPEAAAATVTLTTATAPAKTTETTAAPSDATTPTTSSDKPATTDTPASTSATTKDGSETDDATKESTAASTVKTPSETPSETASSSTSSSASSSTKPTASDPDVKTGNKVEPGATAGSNTPKSSGSSTTTPEEESASADQSAGSTAGADKGADKGAEKSSEKSSAKGAAS